MGVENIENLSQDGKRKARRARVLLAAKLNTPYGELDARLRDLSQKGALVECNNAPPVGTEVVFTRNATIVPARVAWTSGIKVGLEFLRQIDESEVLIQLGRPKADTTQQRFRRPRINGEDMTDQERQLARVWANSVGISVPKK